MATPLGILETGLGIADERFVARPWPRVEILKHDIVERARLPLGDGTLGVVLVAEGDCLAGTSLLAGGHHLAVAKMAVVAVGIDHRCARALDAIGAFLHDAAAAHGHLGIPGLARSRVRARVVEEIEAADLVGAIIRAEARADAAVVDHHIEAFGVVHRRVHGADDLARRVLAVHAGHRLEHDPRVLERALVVTIDPEPMHVSAAQDFSLPYNRTIVLRLTRHDAGLAADAGVEIDAHRPGDSVVG